jgi:LacI family transcriptional regulator
MSEDLPEYSMPNGYDTMKRLLARGADFTAVFAVSDTMAFGAVRALREAGRRVPEDCSIIGYDGQYYTEFMTPSLTTVVQPVSEMALKSVELLDDAIRNDAPPVCVTYDAELRIRESVMRLP